MPSVDARYSAAGRLHRSMSLFLKSGSSSMHLLFDAPLRADDRSCDRRARRRRARPGRRLARGRPPRRRRSTPACMTITDGGQCTANFVYHRRRRHLHRPGRALLRHRRGHRHRRLHSRLAAARHAGRGRRRQPARDARLQLVADDAGATARPTPTPAPTTTSRWSSSTRPTSARSTRRCPASAGPTGVDTRHGGAATTSTRTATRRCAAASPSSARSRARSSSDRGQRLEPHRLHRHARASPATRAAAFLNAPGAGARRAVARSRSRRSPAPTASATSRRELAYAHAHSAFDGLQLVNGTEPFQKSCWGRCHCLDDQGVRRTQQGRERGAPCSPSRASLSCFTSNR